MKYCPQCQQTYAELENVCPTDGTILYFKDLFNLVGQTIANQYVIEALAEIGGMSAVYRARHCKIDREVAFKILLPHLTLNDPEMVRLFEREARAAGQIIHPNIATIYDAGRTSEDLVYIVMEWLTGHTLEKVLEKNAPLDWETTGILLQQITAALEAAHRQRVVHRDLKPSNVMILPQPPGTGNSMLVKILDFGVAKISSTDRDNYVSTAVGTAHYASPEQMLPGSLIDARTDLYALGVMLYEMLTGQLPFDGDSMADIIRQHLLNEPPSLIHVRPDTPPAIASLIHRLLAKRAADRPASAGEVWLSYEQAMRDHKNQPGKSVIIVRPAAHNLMPAAKSEAEAEDVFDVRDLLSADIDRTSVNDKLTSQPPSARRTHWLLIVLVIILLTLVLVYGFNQLNP